MGFIDDIKAKAKTNKKTIVLPETEDIRTYEAAAAVLREGTANLVLVGSEEEIAKVPGLNQKVARQVFAFFHKEEE